jgi:hypothetical protein
MTPHYYTPQLHLPMTTTNPLGINSRAKTHQPHGAQPGASVQAESAEVGSDLGPTGEQVIQANRIWAATGLCTLASILSLETYRKLGE